jgi:putative spermidine/putrescine transport system substrate-binding protein
MHDVAGAPSRRLPERVVQLQGEEQMTDRGNSRWGMLTRRQMIAGSATVAATGLLGKAAFAQAKGEIIVANWGGDWSDRTVRFFEAPIVEKAGYTVVRDLGAIDQRRTKLLAARRLPKAAFDVSHLDDTDAFFMNSQGVLEEFSEKDIPNLADCHEQLRAPYFIPWQFSGWVIAYNPDKVKEPPQKFADLWNTKYAGMIGLTDTHWYHHMEMAAIVNGGDLTNIKNIKSALLDLKKATNPRLYPQHLQQAQAFKNEEVVIGTNYKSRIIQFGAEGVKLTPVFPTEGTVAVTFGAVIPKKAPNKAGALFYGNALIDPAGMAGLAQQSFYAPANKKAVLPPEASKTIEFTEGERKILRSRNNGFWAENRGALLEWWNKEFKA